MVTNVERKEIIVPSSDKIHTLHGVLYYPEGKAVGIFQMIHGMTDYSLRYEEVLREMARHGWIAFSYDQLGHGKSGGEDLGFFAPRDGWRYLMADTAQTLQYVKGVYGDLPTVSAGHSLGSFILRCAVGEGILAPDGLVLLGTSGRNPLAGMGVLFAGTLSLLYGKKHVSPLLYRLVFRNYDERFPGDWHNRWVSVDTENLKRYAKDPYCTFSFTVSAMEDLIRLHRNANRSSFFKRVSCPVLLLSGEDDPVGDYGKGVCQVAKRLKQHGKEAEICLYSGFRHEILNDFCKEEACQKILSFANDRI